MNQILPPYFMLLGAMISASLNPSQRRKMAWMARLAPT
jgi:amidase